MLKKSITKRMFIGITAVVVGFAIIILLSNTLLLSPLYYKSLENQMISSINKLAEIDFATQKEDWVDEIFTISSGSAYDVVIRYEDDTLFSSSMEIGIRSFPDPELEPGPEPKAKDPIGPLNPNIEWRQEGNVSLGYSVDDRNNNEFMVCMTELENNYMIFLTQPVAPVDAGIAQSNMLLIICTAIVLALSILFCTAVFQGIYKTY